MAQYIDKYALVTEIEKLQKVYSTLSTRNNYEDGLKEGRLIGYKDALSKINNLEVKEVGLEKEYFRYMTIEEKAKAYDKAMNIAKKMINDLRKGEDILAVSELETMFPELKESQDEKIRKWIIDDIMYNMNNEPLNNSEYKKQAQKALAWLEKQGEQKSADKVEPKFHEGDWIISNNKKATYQVIEVKRGIYVIRDNADNHEYHIGIEECEKSGRFWNISDAKDGDVLISENDYPFIYAGNHIYTKYLTAYCGITDSGEFEISDKTELWTNDNVEPSTKKERDLLFQKMHDAGYEWDIRKKELRKIEQKPKWSYEDEANLNNIIWLCNNCLNGEETTWIPSQAEKIKHLIETIKERGLT